MPCTTCGAGLRPGDPFCPYCATPVAPPARPRNGVAAAVLAVVVVVGLLVGAAGAAWYVLHRRTDVPVAAGGSTTAPSASAGDRTLPRPTQAPAPRPTSTEAADPGAALDAQAATDRAAAEASVGYWLPQISSKVAGLEVDGVVYDDARILSEFRAAQQRYGAILVRSGDYSTFQRPGLWVVLVPQRNADAAAANAWCDSQGFAAGDCYAKRLSHTDGPSGNTKQR
jgi:hypothetical protein